MSKPNLTRATLKNWAIEDRPREKLLMKGASALSDSELLAILIGSGNREETAVEVCKRILASADNDLNKLARFGVNDFKKTRVLVQRRQMSQSSFKYIIQRIMINLITSKFLKDEVITNGF